MTTNLIYPAYKKSIHTAHYAESAPNLQTIKNVDKWLPFSVQPVVSDKNQMYNVSAVNKANEMYWAQSPLSAAQQKAPHIAFYNDSDANVRMWWPGSDEGNGKGFDVPKSVKRPNDLFYLNKGDAVV